MKEISSSKRLANLLREFFFHMTFVVASGDSWSALCFLAGKLQSLSQPLMLILYATSATRWSDIVSYFEIMTYFRTDRGFYAFVYVLFALVQLFVGLTAFQMLYPHSLLSAEQGLLLSRALYGIFVASARVLPQVCVSALAYTVAKVVSPDTSYSAYKHLMDPAGSPVTVQYYISLALLLITTAEVLIAGITFLGLCQDRSIRNRSFWSANTWAHSAAELCFSVLIQVEFFFDLSVQVSYVLRFIARVLCILVFCFYTKYAHYWVDIAEFLFSTFETAIAGMVLIFTLLDWGFESYVTYPVLLLSLSLLICLIRVRVVWSLLQLHSPKSAVEAIRGLITLATDRQHKSVCTLVGLLAIHEQACQRATCDCRRLIASLAGSERGNEALQVGENVYLQYEELPPAVRDSAIAKATRLLIDELVTHTSKEEELAITMAETDFYVFGNFYTSLQQISQIEVGKPRFMMRQRTYNLRRVISMGMQHSEASKEDPERTLASLKYLKYYHQFMDEVEDATESTIKFWSIVSEEAPSSNILNSLGKALFKCKYDATNTVEKISSIATNQIEFLVRYGLFMRFVMHDLISSEQTFQKIQSLNANVDMSFSSRLGSATNFSIFRFDTTTVMLLVAQMEQTGTGTITEINTAIEQVLGYSRQDIIGSSIVNIMPQTVASVHNEFVQRFFHTMKAYSLNLPRARYVKAKDGFYVLCRCLVKIVPELRGTLQAALFMVEDRKSLCYSSFRRDPTEKKVGAILCVPTVYTVLGFTRAALGILRIPEDRVKEFAGNANIFEIFPWMANRELMDKVFAKEGKIVQSAQIMGANNESENGEGENLSRGHKQQQDSLLWIRFIVEKSESQTLLISLVMSEIARESQDRYKLEPGSDVFYHDPNLKVHYEDSVFAKRAFDQAKAEVDEQRKRAKEAELNISDVASVASMASIATNSQSGTHKSDGAGFYEATRELQIASVTKQTPTAIKGLAIGMATMLAVVGVLMFVGAYMMLKELSQLETRFELIKTYHLRYKAVMMLTDASRSYQWYIYFGSINMVNRVVAVRDQALTDYNVATRKLLFSQGLDYDGETVTLTDMSNTVLQCTFSYALILVCCDRFIYRNVVRQRQS